MESTVTRASNLLTVYLVVLSICGFVNYTTGLLFRPSSFAPSYAHTKVTDFGIARRFKTDMARMTLDLESDVSAAFNWNTKQLFAFLTADYDTPKMRGNSVVVWDAILQSPEEGLIRAERERSKYLLVDYQKGQLKGRDVNLTLHYQYMPKAGFYHHEVVAQWPMTMPEDYFHA